MSTRKDLKSVGELTVLDLDEHPVWEFATDMEGEEDVDETFVRPARISVLPREFSGLLIAADFASSCGQEFEGYVSATISTRWSVFEGVIIHQNRHVDAGSITDLEDLTGLEAEDLLPITFELRVRIEGESSYKKGTLE